MGPTSLCFSERNRHVEGDTEIDPVADAKVPTVQAGSGFRLKGESANAMMGGHMKPSSIHTAAIFGTPWRGLFGTRIESDRQFGKHSHAAFGLSLMERGAQDWASGRGPVDAYAGDVIAFNLEEVHDGHSIGRGSRRWRMVYAGPQVFEALTGTQVELAEGLRALERTTGPVGMFACAFFKAVARVPA